MTVYIEEIFISNFLIDAFIFILTITLLNREINKIKIIISATIGGISSVVIPFVPDYVVLIKCLLVVFLPLLFVKHRNIKSYFTTVSLFIVVTLLLGGAVFGIKCTVSGGDFLRMSVGIVPAVFSIAGIVVIALLVEIRKGYRREKSYTDNLRTVVISDGKSAYKYQAYFDSGNRVYSNNGEPITVVGRRIYNVFRGEEEDVFVKSLSGTSVLKSKSVNLMIYSNDGNNMIYRTRIACSTTLADEKEIILHSEMGG